MWSTRLLLLVLIPCAYSILILHKENGVLKELKVGKSLDTEELSGWLFRHGLLLSADRIDFSRATERDLMFFPQRFYRLYASDEQLGHILRIPGIASSNSLHTKGILKVARQAVDYNPSGWAIPSTNSLHPIQRRRYKHSSSHSTDDSPDSDIPIDTLHGNHMFSQLGRNLYDPFFDTSAHQSEFNLVTPVEGFFPIDMAGIS
jgi:hypothetical protein